MHSRGLCDFSPLLANQVKKKCIVRVPRSGLFSESPQIWTVLNGRLIDFHFALSVGKRILTISKNMRK